MDLSTFTSWTLSVYFVDFWWYHDRPLGRSMSPTLYGHEAFALQFRQPLVHRGAL